MRAHERLSPSFKRVILVEPIFMKPSARYHSSKVDGHNLSACVRINYKRFKSYTGATILHFGDIALARPFVNLAAGYPWTFPDLGIYLKEKGYDNWILRELPDNFIVWTTNKWHHVCLSYSKVNSRIIVVKVQISLFNYMPILTYFVSGWKGY